MTEEKPNEAGLWTREGKFYRVWFDGHYDRIQSIDPNNGFSGDHNYLKHENTPTGNWRKLTPEPAGLDGISSKTFRIEHNPNCVKPFLVRFPGKGKGMIHGDQRDAIGCGMTIIEAINAAEDPYRKITPEPVTNEAARESPGAKGFMECDTCQAKPGTPLLCCGCLTNRTLIAKQSDEIEELKAERDQLHRTREALEGEVAKLKRELEAACNHQRIWANSIDHALGQPRYDGFDLLTGCLRRIREDRAKLSQQPEVIEGRGQAVESEVACYMEEWPDGCIRLVRFGPDSIFKAGRRYMRCHTFPSRAFVAPEKPEFVLCRFKANGKLEWIPQFSLPLNGWEVLDPTTGKPLPAGASK